MLSAFDRKAILEPCNLWLEPEGKLEDFSITQHGQVHLFTSFRQYFNIVNTWSSWSVTTGHVVLRTDAVVTDVTNGSSR